MMKYTITLILILIFSIQLLSQQQGGLLVLDPTPFTFRNAKASFGLYGNANIANDENKSYFNYFTGNLPDEVEIRFDSTQGLPNLSIGATLDIFSPNANIGLMIGCEWNRSTFQLIENQTNINYFNIHRINFPAYLKWKFGKVHARTNVFLAGGAIYGIPLSFTKTNNLVETKDKTALNNTLSISSILGYQFRFANSEKISNNKTLSKAYSRIWLFLRTDYMLSNTFNSEFNDSILTSTNNSQIDYRDLSFTVGIALFLGFK